MVDYLRHEFVEQVPNEPADGVLYVSMEFRTTVHLCCCGCGNVVVLPVRPSAWHLTYDGATISMSPSVGNWSFPCQSHYWICRGRIDWAGNWNDDQIAVGRRQTLIERRAESNEPDEPYPIATTTWPRRLFRWLRGVRQR